MIKRICRGGAGIFNESCGNLHGDGFERDRSDRSILRKEAKIRLRAAFGLTCKKSAEEPVHLRVRVAHKVSKAFKVYKVQRVIPAIRLSLLAHLPTHHYYPIQQQ